MSRGCPVKRVSRVVKNCEEGVKSCEEGPSLAELERITESLPWPSTCLPSFSEETPMLPGKLRGQHD